MVKIRTTETNAKNSKLYFCLLLKSNDVIKSTIDFLVFFKVFKPNLKKR